ncbi:MAG: tetratricopeptide repeat protein [Planctomycetaceae bacterium]|nr:tetratricopeptide repeat protein [Planctomycetaceae bacterium]
MDIKSNRDVSVWQVPHPSGHAEGVETIFQEGLRFHRQGDLVQAALYYRQVLSQTPVHADAWHFLGVVTMHQRDYPTARIYFEKSLALCDTKAVYFNNYGVVLDQLKCPHESQAAYQMALDLNPNYADAWSNLGRLLADQKHYAGAEKALLNAVRLEPNHPDANLHLIDFFRATHRENDAIYLCRNLLKTHPDPVKVKIKLGDLLLHAGRYGDALPVFQELECIVPDHFNVQYGLGQIYAELDQMATSKTTFQRLAILHSDLPLLRWKHLNYCPAIFGNTASVERYWNFLHCELDELLEKQVVIDWRSSGHDHLWPSFHLAHHGKSCRGLREKFSAVYARAFPHRRLKSVSKPRIRIGFVTSRGNEDGLLRGTAGIIKRLDPERFESLVFCFSSSVKHCRHALPDERIGIIAMPDHFEQASQVVRESGCDILYYWKVEPGTWNPFLAMTRPAPVQCTSWGTLGTSGIDALDYYLTSPFMEPEDIDVSPHYTEQVEMLATFPMFEPRNDIPKNVSRDEFGLPRNGAIYFCPHRISKYHPSFDELLRRVLDCDPNGHLLLKIHSSESTAAQQLKCRMTQMLGKSLMRRVIFLGKLSCDQYQRLFSLATAVLDSPVFTGGYTAYDAFSYGVPMVTMPGTVGVQAFTSGFYRKMDMCEMAAHSPEQYVEMAIRLGTDRDFHEAVSRKILERCDVLFNEELAVREFERFFEKAIQKECER